MNRNELPPLRIGEKTARVPIIQGGMSVGVSLAGLAKAVADAGGIGIIGTAGIGSMEPDVHSDYATANKRGLQREIRIARRNTNGLIGVNIMMALSDYDAMMRISIDEGVDFIFIGAGLLLRLPEMVKIEDIRSSKTKIVPIISSPKGVSVMFKYWSRFYDHVPDAVVVEGPMAGGHLGFTTEMLDDPAYALENLVPQVIEEVNPYRERYSKSIPVIAAGGIYTGADIKKYLDMGAEGVQMATRFVATHECDASIKFKQMYIDCRKEDITIIQSPVGMPGRALRNDFLDAVSKGEKMPFSCNWKCLRTCDYRTSPYCIAMALVSAKEGRLDRGFAFAGANAYRVDRLYTVQELIDILAAEYSEAVG
ncbi:MAG: nitronate monooxygenase [Candidatus Thermoplasmatota archaeon]|nr:nitronate monooxygenase [Candidatus Thermoplasmatota archaeon]